jgi:hypothetical protein
MARQRLVSRARVAVQLGSANKQKTFMQARSRPVPSPLRDGSLSLLLVCC